MDGWIQSVTGNGQFIGMRLIRQTSEIFIKFSRAFQTFSNKIASLTTGKILEQFVGLLDCFK